MRLYSYSDRLERFSVVVPWKRNIQDGMKRQFSPSITSKVRSLP